MRRQEELADGASCSGLMVFVAQRSFEVQSPRRVKYLSQSAFASNGLGSSSSRTEKKILKDSRNCVLFVTQSKRKASASCGEVEMTKEKPQQVVGEILMARQCHIWRLQYANESRSRATEGADFDTESSHKEEERSWSCICWRQIRRRPARGSNATRILLYRE